jgi:magnesium chelatase family protein
MAWGIIGAYGGLTKSDVSDYVPVGELSLDGSVCPVRGALPIAVAARANKVKNLDHA